MGNATQERALSRAFGFLRSRPLVWDTLTTTALSTLAKGIGFLIPFSIAAWFGVSADTDAFFFAYGLIIFLAVLFSPVVESIIVPFIAEAKSGGEDVGAFVGMILGISLAGLAVLSALFLLLIKPVLKAVSSFDPTSLDLIFVILVETVPLAVLLVWTSVLSGALNAYKAFSIPALSPAFRAVVTIGVIFAFKDSLGVHSIALGYVAGEAFRLAALFWLLKELNFFHLKISFAWDGKFGRFLKTSSYQIFGMAVLAFTSIINKTMASWIGPGNVSMLEYAERLYMIPVTLLSSGFIVTLLSHWSSRHQIDGDEGLKRGLKKASKVVSIAGLMITLALLFFKIEIVELAYMHGEFPDEKIYEVAGILGFYLLGITPYFLCQIYTRAFLVRKNTKVLLQAALLIIASTVALNFVFIRTIGVAGLSLSSTVVLFLSLAFLSAAFKRG